MHDTDSIFLLSSAAEKSKCLVFVDGKPVEKQIGDVWTTSDDLCMKHTCELSSKGVPKATTFQEYCYYTCYNASST